MGWTKLAMIAKQVTQDNIDELLDLAEQNNVKELERITRGERPLGNSHCVLMYFSPKQYEELKRPSCITGRARPRAGADWSRKRRPFSR